MSLLKQIDDRGVVLEWSPFASQPNFVALATKDSVGAGFDEYGGELEVHELDFSSDSSEPTLRGSVKTQSRFSSLAWSDMSRLQSDFPMGIVAGGMSDGHLNVWDADAISKGEQDPLVMSAEGHHQGAVTTLQFNPHAGWTHSLASGGLDGEVLVMSLERPDAPATYTTSDSSKHNAEITKVAWNTGTHYILASSDNKGSTCVWDMKQRKLWCEIRDPTNGVVSDIAWGPDGGTNLVTVSGDDRNPVIKYWDLKSSTSLPLATLKGHNEGILGVSWCKSDPYLLMSCGKDNRTIIWDLLHCKPVYEFPSDSPAPTQQVGGMGGVGSSNPLFGGISAATGQKRYQATWAPHLPAVAATCSFDRRVQFYSMTGFKSTEGRAPKWLRRSVGATFSFGGKLVKFDGKSSAPGAAPPPGGGKAKPVVEVVQVVEDPELIRDCDNFHKYMAASDFKGLCSDRANNATSEKDREVWNIMNVICFSDNARENLQSHLGFDSAVIKNASDAHVAKMKGLPLPVPGQETTTSATATEGTAETMPPPPGPTTQNGDGAAAIAASLTGGSDDIFGSTPAASEGADFFGSTAAEVPAPTPVVDTKPTTPTGVDTSAADTAAEDVALAASPEIVQATAGMVATAVAGLKSEKIIRRAIVVGNFTAAVDCCIEAGLMAEALLLAQCGDQNLWLRTQAAFFENKGMKYPFLATLNAIIKSELEDYVNKSNVEEWRETLAVLSTYAKSEEFPTLCEILARRLESERNDISAATLCFMCAANIYHVVKAWTDELNEANARLGYVDVRALQRYIEKVNVFIFANRGAMIESSEAADKVNELKNNHYAIYANLLAAQGRLNEAPTYMKDSKNSDEVLIDRLYHSGTKPAGSQPPAFPFTKLNVTYIKAETVQEQQAKAASTSANQYHPNSTNRETFTDNNASANTAQTTASSTFAQPASTVTQVPEGWSSAVDPASGRTYYVNMKTNVSQWEAPPMPVVQATQQLPATNMAGMGGQATNMASSQPLTSGGGAGIGGGMGMGMGMSQPVSAFGGGAQATPAATTNVVAEEPKVNTSIPATPIDSSAVNSLGDIINNLSGVATPVEKRQLNMVNGFYVILQKKVTANEVSQEVMTKIGTYVEHMIARNFPAATAVQIDLAKTEWTAHGKWINGLKMLVPIATKH